MPYVSKLHRVELIRAAKIGSLEPTLLKIADEAPELTGLASLLLSNFSIDFTHPPLPPPLPQGDQFPNLPTK